jgi:probable HAF family extracellular repeat protein
MKMQYTSFALLYCAGLILAGFASVADAAVISNLGTLGGSYSRGFGINASGQVTGGSNAAGSTSNRGFLYTGGTMYDLGTLGGPITFAFAINASGEVAGSSLYSPTSGAQHAFLYTGIPGAGGMMHDLGTLGGRSSRATALNDAGQVTGNAGISMTSTAAHAFRYIGVPGAGGVMQDLGTLGGATSRGFGINAAGQIVGDSQITGGSVTTFHAFLYTGTPGVDGVMTDLGSLGGTSSAGNAINAAGQIAGSSQITGSTDYHAFLYTGTPGAGGTMHDLGTLGGSSSGGYAINSFGQVVGASDTTGNAAAHAFFYTGTPGVDGVMIDLDAWLDANYPAEGANWTLEDASGLTDTGLITGSGQYNDGPGGLTDGLRAYILDASILVPERTMVPEPTTLSLLALSGLILLCRRRVRLRMLLKGRSIGHKGRSVRG